MATERKSPDAILELTNLTGVVSSIQDDPDSPDGNWLLQVSNNADSVCRVSFPTPTGNPTQGAGLQQFKIWVRKSPGQTGTPTVRIELYENGVLLATPLADTNVTSGTGQLFSGTWNANLLSNPDGSGVECRIYGTKTGGALGARATVEVGAVEWNVTYTEAPAYYHGLKVQGIGELALCDVGNHPLRIRKGGVTYGIELVDISDSNASPLRIKTSAGIKALRKYT